MIARKRSRELSIGSDRNTELVEIEGNSGREDGIKEGAAQNMLPLHTDGADAEFLQLGTLFWYFFAFLETFPSFSNA